MIHSRTDNTVNAYTVAFNKWKRWALLHQAAYLPAVPLTFALYLLSLIQADYTLAVIEKAYYGVKYFHTTLSLTDPTSSPLTQEMYEVAKRICKNQKKRKEPFTKDDLEKIYTHLTTPPPPSFQNYRTWTMINLSFVGFLRYDDMSTIRFGDIQFFPTFMKIFLESSKTDVYREGKWVQIAASASHLCPVTTLQQYLKMANITADGQRDQFIFRAITKTKTSAKLRKANRPLSYTRVRELLLQTCKSIGLSAKEYGTHSMRSGGASMVANAGLPDRLFKRHGRWKSDKAKDMYVKDNIDRLLSVTKSMCL